MLVGMHLCSIRVPPQVTGTILPQAGYSTHPIIFAVMLMLGSRKIQWEAYIYGICRYSLLDFETALTRIKDLTSINKGL